ncbi:CAP domain-containing protein [Microbispora sitophila]|uniref:CAP domain-containing protein n=1 Tax=Microbispora sitophila TaxID=2771537 RepID=UPI00299F56D7|nr:CAP domain-containing protein [Microbispora sitophila]
MNRALGAVLCLGSVAAVGMAAGPAQAEAQHAGCRVAAAKPYVTVDGKIRAAGSRAGCLENARFRVRIVKSTPGPDRVVKSGSKVVRNARVVVALTCADGAYYSVVTDYRGHLSRSRPVRLDCDVPTPVPTATSSPSPTAVPTTSPSAVPSTAPATSPTASAPASTTPSASPTSGSAVGTAIENEVVRLTNAERAKAGCGPLKHDPRLRAAAYAHSANMSAQNKMEHVLDGRDPGYRITLAGYTWRAYGENIAKGYGTAQAVVQGWMNSPGHRQNILNCNYTDIGVGYVAAGGPYWTQDFGRQ